LDIELVEAVDLEAREESCVPTMVVYCQTRDVGLSLEDFGAVPVRP
jgi:hypothetical protein